VIRCLPPDEKRFLLWLIASVDALVYALNHIHQLKQSTMIITYGCRDKAFHGRWTRLIMKRGRAPSAKSLCLEQATISHSPNVRSLDVLRTFRGKPLSIISLAWTAFPMNDSPEPVGALRGARLPDFLTAKWICSPRVWGSSPFLGLATARLALDGPS